MPSRGRKGLEVDHRGHVRAEVRGQPLLGGPKASWHSALASTTFDASTAILPEARQSPSERRIVLFRRADSTAAH
jgi:hypothetical protein